MKTVERILIKVAIIQLVLLLLSQFIFHQLGAFPQLKQITKYEGVTGYNITKIVETIWGK